MIRQCHLRLDLLLHLELFSRSVINIFGLPLIQRNSKNCVKLEKSVVSFDDDDDDDESSRATFDGVAVAAAARPVGGPVSVRTPPGQVFSTRRRPIPWSHPKVGSSLGPTEARVGGRGVRTVATISSGSGFDSCRYNLFRVRDSEKTKMEKNMLSS